MSTKKKIKAKPWTPTEVAMLDTMKDAAIAEKTGRSVTAVSAKRSYTQHKANIVANRAAAKKAVRKKQAEVRMAAKSVATDNPLANMSLFSANGRMVAVEKTGLAMVEIEGNKVTILYED